MLARCGELLETKRSSTYPEIGYQAAGTFGWIASWTGVICMTVGVCSAYFVFVSNMMTQLMYGVDPFFTRENCVLVLLPVFILLSWGPYKYLSHFSVIGISALVFALAVVMYDAFSYNVVQPISSYPLFEGSTYPLFVGNTAFVYLIHSVVLPMRNKMKAPLFCPKTLAIAIVFVTVLNMSFALPVYLLYFNNTQGNIIDNLHPGKIKQSVQVALCVDLFFTYALFLFPMCEALENDIRRLQYPTLFQNQPQVTKILRSPLLTEHGKTATVQPAELPWALRLSIRALLVICTALLSYFVKDFSAVSALSGGFGNNMVGFILPPLFVTLIKRKQNWWVENNVSPLMMWVEIGCNTLIGIGGIALLVTSVQSFIANL
jgi:hypothetical protein